MRASGKPDYSRVAPCRCTRNKLASARREHLTRFSGEGVISRFSFDNLNQDGATDLSPKSRALFMEAYRAGLAFAEAPAGQGWLVFTGPGGGGKTHLAAAIAGKAMANGTGVMYVSTPDLLDHLRAAFNPASALTYDEFFEQVRNVPLLVLDDLGAQSGSAWAAEKLDQIINHRYNQRLPTVIVAIVPLDRLDDRLRHKLEDGRSSRVFSLREDSAPKGGIGSTLDLALLQQMTFSNFDPERSNLPAEQRANLADVYQLCREFAKSPDGWLVLQGEYGCGKTHLAAAIANDYRRGGHDCLFVVVPDFLDHLRSTFAPESKVSYDELFESVRNTPLLVLDDFGEQTSTPWAQEKLYQVINYRYNARLPVVITTSLSLDELESRVSSRFVDPRISTVFHIMAPDHRGDVNRGRKRRTTRRRGDGEST